MGESGWEWVMGVQIGNLDGWEWLGAQNGNLDGWEWMRVAGTG